MSFRDIKGQNKAIDYFRHILKNKRLASSYLFIGPEGIGKCLFAKQLAKTINCLNNLEFDSCDSCLSCRKIDKNIHPDVHIIEPDQNKNIKIELIRDLQKDINLRPYEARKKVFIIKQSECLGSESSNAFLKVLEEPPGMSLIILITSDVKRLFPTIVSRCQKVFFNIPKREELADILTQEHGLTKKTSHFLAYFFDGRLMTALKFKDQKFIMYNNRIIDAIINKNMNFLSIEIESGQSNRQTLTEVLDIIISLLRDVWLAKLGFDRHKLINMDREEDIIKLSYQYSFNDLDEIFKFVLQAYSYLEKNINLKLLIQVLSSKLTKKNSEINYKVLDTL